MQLAWLHALFRCNTYQIFSSRKASFIHNGFRIKSLT